MYIKKFCGLQLQVGLNLFVLLGVKSGVEDLISGAQSLGGTSSPALFGLFGDGFSSLQTVPSLLFKFLFFVVSCMSSLQLF